MRSKLTLATMYSAVRSLLFKLDAERAHDLVTVPAGALSRVLPQALLGKATYKNPALYQELFGRAFENPVGVAAGFDKNGTLLGFCQALGCGYVEVGSVSARPSQGNPRPRSFRLPMDQALVNRMGLNNHGAERVAEQLRASLPLAVPLGINIAKTHDPNIMGQAAVEDFAESFRRLAPLADYVALNISCPNTREGQTFEEPAALAHLLDTIAEQRRRLAVSPPLLVKLAPPSADPQAPLDRYGEIVDVCREGGVDGFIAANTASDRAGLRTPSDVIRAVGKGGLSGAPLRERSTRLIRYLYKKTEGRTPIVGVGGIASAEDAYAKVRNGASLLQIYSALVYQGPLVVRRINRGLANLLEVDGFSHIEDAVGIDV